VLHTLFFPHTFCDWRISPVVLYPVEIVPSQETLLSVLRNILVFDNDVLALPNNTRPCEQCSQQGSTVSKIYFSC